jgi:AbrB family looped-hinge helix DNA binding protein
MKLQSKLGERGQVVIPKAIRDNLGLSKNSVIEFELKGNTVTIRPSRDRELHNFELAFKKYAGSLREEFLAEGNTSVDQYLDETRGFDETRRR